MKAVSTTKTNIGTGKYVPKLYPKLCFKNSIDVHRRDVDKSFIGQLPKCNFSLHERRDVIVISDVNIFYFSTIQRLLAEIKYEQEEKLHGVDEKTGRGLAVVGFDTETAPINNDDKKISLIQIATQSTAFLFSVYSFPNGEIPDSLIEILSNPYILKVGIGCDTHDIIAVRTRNEDFNDNSSFYDLTEDYKRAFPKLTRYGLRNLTASILGLNLSKKNQMSNWEIRPYTNGMLNYAANDAFVGLKLFRVLTGKDKCAKLPPCTKYVVTPSAAANCCDQIFLVNTFGLGHNYKPCGCSFNSDMQREAHIHSKRFIKVHSIESSVGNNNNNVYNKKKMENGGNNANQNVEVNKLIDNEKAEKIKELLDMTKKDPVTNSKVILCDDALIKIMFGDNNATKYIPCNCKLNSVAQASAHINAKKFVVKHTKNKTDDR
jgi:ribonuclease D